MARKFVNTERTTWLDTVEAAAYLEKSPRTLEKWRLMRSGPKFLRGDDGKIRYSTRDLDTWEKAQ